IEIGHLQHAAVCGGNGIASVGTNDRLGRFLHDRSSFSRAFGKSPLLISFIITWTPRAVLPNFTGGFWAKRQDIARKTCPFWRFVCIGTCILRQSVLSYKR